MSFYVSSEYTTGVPDLRSLPPFPARNMKLNLEGLFSSTTHPTPFSYYVIMLFNFTFFTLSFTRLNFPFFSAAITGPGSAAFAVSYLNSPRLSITIGLSVM